MYLVVIDSAKIIGRKQVCCFLVTHSLHVPGRCWVPGLHLSACDGLRLCFRQAVTVITIPVPFLTVLEWDRDNLCLGSLSSLHPNVSILEVQMISCVYVVIFYIIGCSGYIWKSIASVLLRQGFTLVQTDSECTSSSLLGLQVLLAVPL